MIIDWQPLLFCFLGASAIMYFRGGQNHLGGFVLTLCILLGLYEIWCKINTGHTMSQEYTKWYLRDSVWAMAAMSLMIQAMIFLGFHFFLGRIIK